MLSSAKQKIKTALNAMCIEAHRFHPETSPLARLFVDPVNGRTMQWDGLFFRS
jgi:hypothetical protein